MGKQYEYTIHRENSLSMFIKVCKIIEKTYPGIKKEKLLIDVDGSTIQTYVSENGSLNVYDDYYVGAVFVESDFDIAKAFDIIN